MIENGICEPKSTGLYTVENIAVSLTPKQIWNFKHGMLNGKNVVKVSRNNVRLYLSKEEFEEDWLVQGGADNGRE